MRDWRRQERWIKQADTFAVEIVHVQRPALPEGLREWRGRNDWFVYAYFYPEHPHFAAFDGDEMWQPATENIPLHGGCTLVRPHVLRGKVASIQVGCDYQHAQDERFSHMALLDDAEEVLRDAEELFAWMVARTGPQPTPTETP